MTDLFNKQNAVAGGGSWFKFANIGDKVSGKFVSTNKQADQFNPGKFKNVVTLETGTGLVNVTLKDNQYFNYNISKMSSGDDVGFLFDSLVEGKPGMQKAKSIKIYHIANKQNSVFNNPVGKNKDEDSLDF